MRRNPSIPIILIFVVMAMRRMMMYGAGGLTEWLMNEIMMLPGIVIAISFHEFGHAYVSDKLGDPTPERDGRITLNPIAHIDPVGMACLVFCGFGWGIPVRIDPTFYPDRKKGQLMVGFAGVAMNLLLAVVFTIILRLMMPLSGVIGADAWQILFNIFYYTIMINIVLMVFNLLPIPPLDGFGIATQLFDLEKYDWYPKLYNYGYFILIAAVLFGVVGLVISPLTDLIMSFLSSTILGI